MHVLCVGAVGSGKCHLLLCSVSASFVDYHGHKLQKKGLMWTQWEQYLNMMDGRIPVLLSESLSLFGTVAERIQKREQM